MRTGLLLIDIQNDYFPGGRMALTGMTEASFKAQAVLAMFRERDLPLFHIQHIAAKDAPFFEPGTSGVEIHPSVSPAHNEPLIQKRFPNSFRETDLAATLTAAAIEQVVICGAMSHMCIDATTRAAADHGLKCIVLHDACATRELVFNQTTITAASAHGAFMAALGAAYAQVMSTDEFLKGF